MTKSSTFLTILLLTAAPAFSQMGMMRPPDMPGLFRPTVGTGAAYKITNAGRTNEFAFAIVGKEADGYWMEIRTNAGPGGGVVMKELVSGENGSMGQPKRMIMQTGGRPPMEMPMAMMGEMAGAGAPRGMVTGDGAGGHGMGAKVGTETITVPAGTFEWNTTPQRTRTERRAMFGFRRKCRPMGW